jgi:hypothetical protein
MLPKWLSMKLEEIEEFAGSQARPLGRWKRFPRTGSACWQWGQRAQQQAQLATRHLAVQLATLSFAAVGIHKSLPRFVVLL